MPTILREFGSAMSAGDIYLSNDPYLGGTHLPDVLLFKPLFHLVQLYAGCATRAARLWPLQIVEGRGVHGCDKLGQCSAGVIRVQAE